MQKRLAILLILVMVLMILPVPASGQDAVEFRIAWWGSQDRHDRTIAAIELYEELNPNVHIVYEFSGWADHWTKMGTQAAGGSLPDIMQQDYAYLQEWVANGTLMPLDEFVESGEIDTSNISEASLSGGRVDGQLYGINLGNNSQVIAIDVDAFERAGMDLPPLDWTWQDFEEIVLELHEKLGIWGVGSEMQNEGFWKAIYMSCCDAWAYNADGTALGYDDDQPLIDYFNMLLRLQEAGAMPPIDVQVAEYIGQGVESRPIVAGDAVMQYFQSNQLVAVWSAAGEDRNFVLYHLPRVEGGLSANYIKPSMFWSITSQATQPEEAAKFIDWFVNSVEANEILFAERGVPVSSAIREALLPELGPAQREMFEFLGRVEDDNSPIRPPDPAGHGDIISNVYNPEFAEAVLYGVTSVEDGVALLREEATRILAETGGD
jgi:multiple sugar transport system substrate-binding protein